MTIQIRQGDVWLESATITEAITAEVPPTRRGLVLQEGEVTGHAHRIGPVARHASLYRTETDARYLRVTAPVELTHEEHKTRCAVCREFEIATSRVAGIFDAAAYRCERHRGDDAINLDAPGATVIPPGDYRISIHAEYQPGALPRQVED